MKNNYGISDQDAARMLGVWGAWQANPANWRLGTPLGMTKNVNGQVSPTQDRMTRSIIDSARDKEFRDRVLSGYEEAIRKGQVKIVDDPTKK
jgi:hypothetical protein